MTGRNSRRQKCFVKRIGKEVVWWRWRVEERWVGVTITYERGWSCLSNWLTVASTRYKRGGGGEWWLLSHGCESGWSLFFSFFFLFFKATERTVLITMYLSLQGQVKLTFIWTLGELQKSLDLLSQETYWWWGWGGEANYVGWMQVYRRKHVIKKTMFDLF